MDINPTTIKDCFEIIPQVFKDERGYFFESFNHQKLEEAIQQKINFVQDNQSYSYKGVLRGLHFQKGEHAQAKLVRVLDGIVLDVVVDIRKNSATYGKIHSTVLSQKNRKQLFIPKGCAHGFVTLSKTAIFFYKCDNYYHKNSEAGIIYNDRSLQIDWQLPESDLIISDKDKVLPLFKELNYAH
tara:strand:+ start:9139 stop:9690 length:552 start_codon:yes stop_codon:yes gene_type:complete